SQRAAAEVEQQPPRAAFVLLLQQVATGWRVGPGIGARAPHNGQLHPNSSAASGPDRCCGVTVLRIDLPLASVWWTSSAPPRWSPTSSRSSTRSRSHESSVDVADIPASAGRGAGPSLHEI